MEMHKYRQQAAIGLFQISVFLLILRYYNNNLIYKQIGKLILSLLFNNIICEKYPFEILMCNK